MSRVMDRVMDIATPLGEDVLLFHGMRAREELGRLSEYHLDLLSADGEIDVDAILGKNVTIKLALPDDSTRYFNGYVTRFAQGELHGRYYQYTATVHPWLWFLTRTSDCRIFQEMTVPDIIKKVFADHGTADFKLELTSTYRKWTYCVQYRETDFNFVSRLMEQEGIYYYFRHTDGHNTLVLTDSCSKHVPCPGYEELAYIPPEQPGAAGARAHQPLAVRARDPARRLRAQGLRPRAAERRAEDAEGPAARLQPEQLRGLRLPGRVPAESRRRAICVGADRRARDAVRDRERASTNARGVAVGALFTLDKCPRADQNREHLVVAANYDLEFSDYEALPRAAAPSYQCSFAAMSTEAAVPAAAARRRSRSCRARRPRWSSGPAGDEIYTDKFGRVKVQFHWDRLGKKDENSSCWIRVSHPWAGKGWGAVATPRIGQEVIVDFLEGDPDQPIITGRVYNAESQPPFGFPAGAVISGIKSNTHKGRRLQRAVDGRHGRQGARVHPRPVQHGHRRSSTTRRRRSTTAAPTAWTWTTRRASATTRSGTSASTATRRSARTRR